MTDTEIHNWIEQHAAHLATLEPDAPLADLRPLAGLRDASIVALGTSSRGSTELSLLAHRMIRFLVQELGFRSVVLEGDDESSAVLDEYLRTGRGDPEQVLAAGRSFNRTREILDVLRWMRAHNQAHPDDPLRLAHPSDPRLATTQLRDLEVIERQLAENTLDWQQRTGHKVVYWGGIAHTMNGQRRTVAPGQTQRNGGARLRGRFGAGYVSVGLLFDRANPPLPVPGAPAEFVEAPLRDAGADAYLLDLREAATDPPPARPVRDWLHGPAKTRLVGPGYQPEHDAEHYISGGSLAEWFDLLGYVREVNPPHSLGERPIG